MKDTRFGPIRHSHIEPVLSASMSAFGQKRTFAQKHMTANKMFRIPASSIEKLVESSGWCVATDRVMVDGSPIGYMCRDAPTASGDSGWRFFAGDEDQAYMANNANHGVYALNTVVNYDTDVIPYLTAEPGSRFDKASDGTYILLQ